MMRTLKGERKAKGELLKQFMKACDASTANIKVFGIVLKFQPNYDSKKLLFKMKCDVADTNNNICFFVGLPILADDVFPCSVDLQQRLLRILSLVQLS